MATPVQTAILPAGYQIDRTAHKISRRMDRQETRRFEKVSLQIENLHKVLELARINGGSVIKLLRLDNRLARGRDWLGIKRALGITNPAHGRSDLKSDAYQMFWDYLHESGYKPVIVCERVEMVSGSRMFQYIALELQN